MLRRFNLVGTESYSFFFQVDEEPAIRTNTTILLGNIAGHLNDAVIRCLCQFKLRFLTFVQNRGGVCSRLNLESCIE